MKPYRQKEKKLIIFDKENYSSDLHCQNGSAFDSNDEIFEWLSEIELPLIYRHIKQKGDTDLNSYLLGSISLSFYFLKRKIK